MMCPSCNSAYSTVYKTVKIRNRVRRHRTCKHCQRNFSTTETVNVPKTPKIKRVDAEDDDNYYFTDEE